LLPGAVTVCELTQLIPLPALIVFIADEERIVEKVFVERQVDPVTPARKAHTKLQESPAVPSTHTVCAAACAANAAAKTKRRGGIALATDARREEQATMRSAGSRRRRGAE
jgi:hypothetical protein